ncbi:MAG: hypothetical protein ABSC42_00840 [Tepidisphaeraceae bacterium]
MEIIYQEHPVVTIATNHFVAVPIIIQFEQTPLLEVGKFEPAGYTTRFPVYHSDGTRLAIVNGCRIHPTDDGKKADIKVRQQPELSVFELEGKPILELRRDGPAALKGWAELWAPEGVLVKAHDSGVSGLLRTGADALMIGNSVFHNCGISGWKIGIHIFRLKDENGKEQMRWAIGSNGIIPK